MIIGCLGPEGAGKSALMTWLTLYHHAKGGDCYAFPGYNVYQPRGGQQVTRTIRVEDWIDLGPQFDGSLVDIDEVQQFFGSDTWNTLANRLFGFVCMQRRKRGMTIVYTVQNAAWAVNRLRWLTHVYAHCFDLYWSSWGKEQGLRRGEMSAVTFIDNKGFYTGREGQTIGQINLRMKDLWPCFESFSVVNVWEAMTKVVVKKREVHVDASGSAPAADYPDFLPDGLMGGMDEL